MDEDSSDNSSNVPRLVVPDDSEVGLSYKTKTVEKEPQEFDEFSSGIMSPKGVERSMRTIDESSGEASS